jgi:hypothetical protein
MGMGAKTKGWIKNKDTGELMSFQFNPEKNTYGRTAVYKTIGSAGTDYPLTAFIRGEARTFSVPLFLYDRPYTGYIPQIMSFLNKLLPSESSGIVRYNAPPVVTFCYGRFIKDCVVESMEVEEQEFDGELDVIQSSVTLTLRQV